VVLSQTNDNKHRIGDGPRQIPVWLRREEPLMLTGLDEYPKVGDRYEKGAWHRFADFLHQRSATRFWGVRLRPEPSFERKLVGRPGLEPGTTGLKVSL